MALCNGDRAVSRGFCDLLLNVLLFDHLVEAVDRLDYSWPRVCENGSPKMKCTRLR